MQRSEMPDDRKLLEVADAVRAQAQACGVSDQELYALISKLNEGVEHIDLEVARASLAELLEKANASQ